MEGVTSLRHSFTEAAVGLLTSRVMLDLTAENLASLRADESLLRKAQSTCNKAISSTKGLPCVCWSGINDSSSEDGLVLQHRYVRTYLPVPLKSRQDTSEI